MNYAGMYILGTKSRLNDIPTVYQGNSSSTIDPSNDQLPIPPRDGVIPLYTYRPHEHRWRRLAGIPECLVGGITTMCINDGFSSMATCVT